MPQRGRASRTRHLLAATLYSGSRGFLGVLRTLSSLYSTLPQRCLTSTRMFQKKPATACYNNLRSCPAAWQTSCALRVNNALAIYVSHAAATRQERASAHTECWCWAGVYAHRSSLVQQSALRRVHRQPFSSNWLAPGGSQQPPENELLSRCTAPVQEEQHLQCIRGGVHQSAPSGPLSGVQCRTNNGFGRSYTVPRLVTCL